MIHDHRAVSYFRNFIFGVEDSLVSTVGLLSGVALAGMSRSNIVVAGIVLIFVEAFSMGVGSFLSESSAEEYEEHTEKINRRPITASGIMFLSYFVSGFIPLSPYLLVPINLAFPLSVVFSLAALFLLGIVSGRISKTGMVKNGTRMLTIGGAAVIVGIVVGQLAKGI